MKQQEGVIKYTLDHESKELDEHISVSEINAWRLILFKLQFIGQIKERYGGFAFGNISQRIKKSGLDNAQFVITGTQTGKFESLSKKDYCSIVEADPYKNQIKSTGQIKPSSEALTHASVYQHNSTIQSVIHVHSPGIWNHSKRLKLPCTSANITYGTPEMAYEVERLLNKMKVYNTGIFCMLGHEDGIVVFSDSMEKAACLLITCYSKAIAFKG